MGRLSFFSKPEPTVLRLPTGSFTVDRDGAIIASTLPHWFPERVTQQIGQAVLGAFRSALEAQVPLSELILHYAALKITARELRGGAIVFFRPVSSERNL